MGQAKPKVVVVGGGFGGLWATRALARAEVEITLVDKTNHHLFQPLLYQVATAGLSPADIAQPIRSILRHQRNVTVLLDEVTGVDRERRCVLTRERCLDFDYLVLAPGMQNSYFGHEEWARIAPGLKTVEDATAMRAKVLMAFEQAEMAGDAQRPGSLTFVIVGGGPTGVELAGAIAELARRVLAEDFRHIRPDSARVILIEGGPRLLPMFPEDLAEAARRALESLGVEVLLQEMVEAVEPGVVRTQRQVVEAATILWAAGVRAQPVAGWLALQGDARVDRIGRVVVDRHCALPDDPNIFVVGDAMVMPDHQGPLPGVAQTAMQQGAYVGRLIRARVHGEVRPDGFIYRDKGNMATIGRRLAVAQIGRWHVAGTLAWLLWLLIHITYLIGFDNKLRVLIEWAWAYIFWVKGARLITQNQV